MQAIPWEPFLSRTRLVLDHAQTAATLENKRILVTGAGGWIGSALTAALAAFAPSRLILLEASERNLYEIDAALPSDVPHVSVLGSILQSGLLAEIFERYSPQVVYHAAAFKHVPLMEQNPFAAIENNALGTSLLVKAAERHATEQVILLSTDKAVDPVSIMGASKRIAEMVVLGARRKAVRLGNVLGSEGSIVPLFLKQIASGVPVTVTHAAARRYFLTTADAVTLLLHAASAGPGILVPELGEPIKVEALARYLIQTTSSTATVIFSQLRPGDKMCEVLLSKRESYVTNGGLLRQVASPCMADLDDVLQQLQKACLERSLEQLLQAVTRAVPEYEPGELLRASLGARQTA